MVLYCVVIVDADGRKNEMWLKFFQTGEMVRVGEARLVEPNLRPRWTALARRMIWKGEVSFYVERKLQ